MKWVYGEEVRHGGGRVRLGRTNRTYSMQMFLFDLVSFRGANSGGAGRYE